jgi:polyferredoxin
MRLSISSPTTSARRLVDRRGRLGTALFARRLVQAGFALTTVLVGVQFTRFVLAAQDARLPLPERPPGVEAFLPISGLMGLRDWFHQGELNSIHPAASIIVLLAIVVSWLLRKSFCSWICPIGVLSEALAALGRRIYGRNPRPWRALDVVLRSLKYVLLAFFLYAILTMHEIALRVFLESPYNRVADVKMGLFFVHAGTVTVVVMAILILGSTLWS